MSQDIPYQARNLVKRMLSDRNVDIANHWKMITLMIGGNDFCAEICYMATPEKILEYHEKNIVSALRTFRDYLPRTFVNLAASPSECQLRTTLISFRTLIATFNFALQRSTC